jgi:hypothetical protein
MVWQGGLFFLTELCCEQAALRSRVRELEELLSSFGVSLFTHGRQQHLITGDTVVASSLGGQLNPSEYCG